MSVCSSSSPDLVENKEENDFTLKISIVEGLTFDDVLLVPNYSEVTPDVVNISSFLTPSIRLNVPFISSPMDTITEALMAIEMAKNGAVGVVHKNMSIDRQKNEIELVKSVNVSISEYPLASRNIKDKLIVGGAIGVGSDSLTRAGALLSAGADFLVVDSAHGHSLNVLNTVTKVKTSWPSCQLIAGNVVTYEGAKAILEAGADTVKVGIGAGSICTTRIVAGVGVPQLTAVQNCVRAARQMKRCLISDGGLKFSGDVVKALAVGADTVMCGSMFAGCDECPGEVVVLTDGRKCKSYRGMGSQEAMQAGSADRYFQKGAQIQGRKLVPEGVAGRVSCKGGVGDVLYQLAGGLRAGMGYLGAATVTELPRRAQFVKISNAGLRESHVHDVTITSEVPNYRVGNK